jgi:hypothetical protein
MSCLRQFTNNEEQEIKYWEEWSEPVEASILKGKIGNQTLFMN